jgi:NAD dependent epimerase/dehydratase family enzyme
MKEFAQTLASVLHRPSLFPVPKFILRLVVGEASEVVLASQRIDVKKLVESGYKFKFEILEDALKDLLR